MAEERANWKAHQPQMPAHHLVFLDETSLNTQMTRLYGRAPKTQRCKGYVPYGHWKTTTFIAALRANGLQAPMALDGPMTGEAFLAYIQQFVVPTLHPGDIVIADNLPSHKVTGVREAVEAVGATYLDLPPYSPDLNPIEQFFSKLKTFLKKAACRTLEELLKVLAKILDGITPEECARYLQGAGYCTDLN